MSDKAELSSEERHGSWYSLEHQLWVEVVGSVVVVSVQ